ncbi:MAG TPA: NADH-quinone oxidoreductase subunit A, partial [Planctomycetaceae bacterium]|nr:NADH-quinone oxidoreductase subunit A [Planctomycetaceae bacterium]
YGSVMQLADSRLDEASRQILSGRLLSIAPDAVTPAQTISAEAALQLGWLGVADILVFFCVLLVGFAYVWKRGDLDWIRALAKKSAQAADQSAVRA